MGGQLAVIDKDVVRRLPEVVEKVVDDDHRPPTHHEDRSLESLAAEALNLVWIENLNQPTTPNAEFIPQPLPLISDPFWKEFHDWRRDNPEAYQEWLNNLHQDDQESEPDQVVPDSNPEGETSDSRSEISSTEAESEDFSSTTDSSYDSSILFYILTREVRNLLADNLRVANIHRPPRNLNRFMNAFNVNHSHRRLFEGGVRIFATVSHTRHKHPSRVNPVVDKYMHQLKLARIIEPAKKGPHQASLFIIPKKNNEATLIVDYSNLTPFLIPPKYFLPSIFQLIHRKVFPCRTPHFVKIDLKNALS